MNPLTNSNYVQHLTDSIRYVVPEAALVATACLLFVLAVVRVPRIVPFATAVLGLFGACYLMQIAPTVTLTAEQRALSIIDPTGLAGFIRGFALMLGLLYVILAWSETDRGNTGEYLGCLMVLTAGLSLVGRANDLTTMFLSLEMISIPTYVMLYLPQRSATGQEASLKYFLLSVLSAGILLFGMSYLYGVTGATKISTIAQILTTAGSLDKLSPYALVGILFVIAGLAFRMTAVPFHFYAPDVYEGAPNGVVAQLAVVPKIAGFVALARFLGLVEYPVLAVPFDASTTLIPLTLTVIAAVTMTLGNLLALVQDNLRRMLAYSGIAHGGYMLIGILVACTVPTTERGANQSGLDALLFYLVAYALMTIGMLAVMSALTRAQQPIETIDDLTGLGTARPWSAASLSVSLVSLIGLPLTAGFVGKFLLFVSAFDVPTDTGLKNLLQVLVIVAAVNAAIAAVYYLRVLGVMYLRSPLSTETEQTAFKPALLVALFCALGSVILGVYPQPLRNLTRQVAPVSAVPAPTTDAR